MRKISVLSCLSATRTLSGGEPRHQFLMYTYKVFYTSASKHISVLSLPYYSSHTHAGIPYMLTCTLVFFFFHLQIQFGSDIPVNAYYIIYLNNPRLMDMQLISSLFATIGNTALITLYIHHFAHFWSTPVRRHFWRWNHWLKENDKYPSCPSVDLYRSILSRASKGLSFPTQCCTCLPRKILWGHVEIGLEGEAL